MLLKIIEKSLNCFHPHTEYKKYLEFNFPKNDILLSKAKKRGVDMAKKVNVRNPSGKIRDLDQLIAANCRGALTEICTKLLLENSIKKRGIG